MKPSRMAAWLFAIGVTIALSACMAGFTTERVTDNQYAVGAYTVRETIDRVDAFPDAVYERVYTVKNGRFPQKIGTYRDESSAGIMVAPEIVGEWLAIYSGSHLFLWQPDGDVRDFDPYRADGWFEYAEQYQLNGHYDYRVARFWVENGRWWIKYQALRERDGYPATLLFSSDDEGQRYVLENNGR